MITEVTLNQIVRDTPYEPVCVQMVLESCPVEGTFTTRYFMTSTINSRRISALVRVMNASFYYGMKDEMESYTHAVEAVGYKRGFRDAIEAIRKELENDIIRPNH